MIQVSTAKDAALSRISAIVEELIKTNTLYQEELDKNELMQIFSDLLDRVVEPEEIISLDGDRLTKRVSDGVRGHGWDAKRFNSRANRNVRCSSIREIVRDKGDRSIVQFSRWGRIAF